MDIKSLCDALIGTFSAPYARKIQYQNIKKIETTIEKLTDFVRTNSYSHVIGKELGKITCDANKYIFNVWLYSLPQKDEEFYNKICKVRKNIKDIRLELLKK